MKVKTNELEKAALDWVVANLENEPVRRDPMGFGIDSTEGGYWVWPEFQSKKEYMKIGRNYSPSTKWPQGGPIIEREKICPDYLLNGQWLAVSRLTEEQGYGPTPLIAAMRCYVASKLGTEVEVPAVLMEGNQRG